MKTATESKLRTLAKDTFKALEPYVNLYDAGLKVNGTPLHVITKECRDLFFRAKNGERDLRYKSGEEFSKSDFGRNILTARDVEDTMCGSYVYYYTSGTQGKALLYLDGDAHNGELDIKETSEAIHSFLGAKHLLHRDSTRGFNKFLKLNYGVYTKRDKVNAIIGDFENAWKRYQSALGLKCGVEVKGTITTKAKSGSLAKLPCTKGWTRQDLDTFNNMPEVSLEWLKGATDALTERATKLEAEKPKPTKVVVEPKKSRLRAGSCTGLPLTPEELDAIPQELTRYKQIAYHCMAYHVTPAKGKKLTLEDFQQALVVLSICARYPNKDGSMPTRRIQAIWNALYDDGIFSRGWDNSRFAAIRNTLADLDYLDLEDEAYFWFQNGEKKGQAMKWALKAQFCCDFVLPETVKNDSAVSTSIFARAYSPNAHDYVPERWRPEPKDPRRSLFDAPDWEERLIMAIAS